MSEPDLFEEIIYDMSDQDFVRTIFPRNTWQRMASSPESSVGDSPPSSPSSAALNLSSSSESLGMESFTDASSSNTDSDESNSPVVAAPCQLTPTAPVSQSQENLAAEVARFSLQDDDSPVLYSSVIDVGNSLLCALECPVCMDYMTPPIGLCCNGHNTCQKCRPQMNCCPICRQEFIETRNLAMETIARELQYPCRNRAAGCDEKYPMELINAHQAVCPRRTYNCMLGGMENCEWKGRRHEILSHARQDHSAHVWVQDTFSLVYTEFEQSTDADLIEALGELFVLHRRYDVEKQRLYAMVQYLGPTENAALFKYEFEFVELGELRSVLFRNVVHHDTSDADEIFESGNCVSLGFDVIVNFIKDKELWCTVKVSHV